jgi:hypothetical protein
MGKRKSSFRDTREASPLASLVFEATTPPNIRTLFSEGKEDTSERPGDISGMRIEILGGSLGMTEDGSVTM